LAVGSGTTTQVITENTKTAAVKKTSGSVGGGGEPPDGGGGSASGAGSGQPAAKAKPKLKPKAKAKGGDRKKKPSKGGGGDDPDDPSDDDDEEDISDGEIVRRYRLGAPSGTRPGRQRKKELDNIEIHDLPKTAAHYRTWFFGVTNAVAAAGLDPDTALNGYERSMSQESRSTSSSIEAGRRPLTRSS